VSIEAQVGLPLYLSIGLEGYETGSFPRMVLRRSDDTLLPESPIDFTAVGSDGQYTAIWTPSEAGAIAGYIVVYEDALHTTRSTRFEPLPAQFRVWARDQDETAKRVLALLGENSRVIVSGYGPSGDPSGAVIYIYDTESDAADDINRTGEIAVQTLFNPSLPDILIRRKLS
jgi:hypothetical protein